MRRKERTFLLPIRAKIFFSSSFSLDENQEGKVIISCPVEFIGLFLLIFFFFCFSGQKKFFFFFFFSLFLFFFLFLWSSFSYLFPEDFDPSLLHDEDLSEL